MFSFLKSKLFIFCFLIFSCFFYVYSFNISFNQQKSLNHFSSPEISIDQYKTISIYNNLLLDYFSNDRLHHPFHLSTQSLSSDFLIPSSSSHYVNLKILLFEIYKDHFISLKEYNSLSNLSKTYFLQDFPQK